MSHQIKLTFTALILMLSFSFSSNAFGETHITWNQITNPNNAIQVYVGDVAGSKILALKGRTVLDFPVEDVVAVLFDVPQKNQWVKALSEARIIKSISKYDYIEYNIIKTPWPIQNRDFVFRTTILPDKKDRSIKVHMKSINDPLMPANQDYIRGEIYNTTFLLKPIDVKQTEIIVEIHADPKGSVPAWLVNLFQKKWPKQTIHGLIKQLQKKKALPSFV